jgi:hypothetical protein
MFTWHFSNTFLLTHDLFEPTAAERMPSQANVEMKSLKNQTAGTSSSNILADRNSPSRFNYTDISMTDISTQLPVSQPLRPDVQDFDIMIESTTMPHPEASSSSSSSDFLGSKIDQSIPITDSTPVVKWLSEEERAGITSEILPSSQEESSTIIFPMDRDSVVIPTLIGNTASKIRFADEETTTVTAFENPKEILMTRKRILVPFIPEPQPQSQNHQQPHDFDGSRRSTEDRGGSRIATELLSFRSPPPHNHHQSPKEEDIDRRHHTSRTRNRERNPDFIDNPPPPPSSPFIQFPDHTNQEFVRHHLTSRGDFDKELLAKPISGSSYPQQFVSYDYLRLGDNYRRFRVF